MSPQLKIGVQEVLTAVFKKEVKTPLSFYFKFPWVIVLVVASIAWAPHGDAGFKLELFWGTVVLCSISIVAVWTLAWFKPKNLVYGESGHRSETRLGMGTETRLLNPEDVAALPGTRNPKSLLENTR